MSIKIMNRVWQKSKCKGTDLLLLLALADNAGDDGYCWPGIEYLAHKIRMTPQSVINITRRIEKAGELLVKHSRRAGNKYLVLVEMTDDEKCAGVHKMQFNPEQLEAITQNLLHKACFTSEVKVLDNRSKAALLEEPSVTIKEPSIENVAEENTDGRAWFVSLADLCEVDLAVATKRQKQQLGQSSKLLKDKADATPEQIVAFGKWWYLNDWRGKQGQAPTPAQVREVWRVFKKHAPAGKFKVRR